MKKTSKNLLRLYMISIILMMPVYSYASVEENLIGNSCASEQHIDKVKPVQQSHYDISLSTPMNLSIQENVSSNEDSILILDNSKWPEGIIPKEALFANSSDPDYLFLWHDSQGNVNWIDEQGFLNRISKEGVYHWTGLNWKQYCITKKEK